MSYKTNQVTFRAQNLLFEEILFDDYVELSDADVRKIQAEFTVCGEEETNETLVICFWGDVADKLAAFKEGEMLAIKCKVSTKFVQKRDDSGDFPITEVIGFFVQSQERFEKEQRSERENRYGGNDRGGKTSDRKERRSGQDRNERRRETQPEEKSDRTGNQRSENRENRKRYRPENR